jgi:hypothetical protein
MAPVQLADTIQQFMQLPPEVQSTILQQLGIYDGPPVSAETPRTQTAQQQKSNPLANMVVGEGVKYGAKKAGEAIFSDAVKTPEVLNVSRVGSNVPFGPGGDPGGFLPGGGPGSEVGVQTPGMSYGDMGGYTAMAINGMDALNNILHGSRKNKIEGGTTAVGTGIGYALGGPLGGGIGSIAGRTVGRGLASVFGGHRTKDAEQKRWGELGAGEGSPAYDAAHGEGSGWNGITGATDENGDQILADSATNMDAANKMRGVYGNYSVFGKDWNNYTPEQQSKIVQGISAAKLYDADMGDITITDAEKAKQIRDGIIGSTPAAQAPSGSSAPAQSQGPGRKRRYNQLPNPFEQPQQAPITPYGPQQQPGLRTVDDFANSIMDVYRQNSGQDVFNPLARRI